MSDTYVNPQTGETSDTTAPGYLLASDLSTDQWLLALHSRARVIHASPPTITPTPWIATGEDCEQS